MQRIANNMTELYTYDLEQRITALEAENARLRSALDTCHETLIELRASAILDPRDSYSDDVNGAIALAAAALAQEAQP